MRVGLRGRTEHECQKELPAEGLTHADSRLGLKARRAALADIKAWH